MSRFEFAHVADGIARQAGALLRGFYAKGVATEYKGDVDLVTEADALRYGEPIHEIDAEGRAAGRAGSR